MKKTTQIHIGGRHFFMDEDAFGQLNHYLESLKLHFSKEGDTGREIVDDIEHRIAELLENKFTEGNQSVSVQDVNEIITTLGNVEDFSYTLSSQEPFVEDTDKNDKRRLFRNPENFYIGGVAGGLADYFHMDPLWLRIAFVLLVFLKGIGLLIYAILWIVVPKAKTTAEKLQMKGKPVNLSTIRDSVNDEYERLRMSVNNSGGPRERNIFENMMRAVGIVVLAMFKFFIVLTGILLLVMGSVFLAGLVLMVLGFTNGFGYWPGWYGNDWPNLMQFFGSTNHFYLALIALVIVFLIPVTALIYGGIKILFNIKGRHPVLRACMLTSWILAFILFVTMVILNMPKSMINAETVDKAVLETGKQNVLIVKATDNMENKRTIRYSILGYHFIHSKWDDRLYDAASLQISLSPDNQTHLDITRRIKNIDPYHAEWYAGNVSYSWTQSDSLLSLNRYFYTDDEDFWMFPEVRAELKIPSGNEIILTKETCEILVPEQKSLYCSDSSIIGKKTKMSPEGTLMVIQ